MTEPLIQTTDLSRTFQALRNRDPLKLERQTVPTHPDYRRVPSSNYSPITSVNTGSWGNGMARFASSSGIVYGQPQFFSPVHTPINWQIPSKRLEEYQWMYLPNTQVLREDFTYESIENNIFSCNNIIDDDVTGGFIFETDNYPKILNSEGKFNRPPRIGMRECENKKCFSIATIGNYGIIKVSEEHNLFVLDGNIHRRNKKVLGNKKYRESKGIKPNGVEKVKIQDRLIKKIKAQDVSKLDYLLTPVPKIGEVSIDKDLAWLIGFCVADGCIYEKDGSYSVRFTGYKDEKALLHCKEILEKKFDGKITSKPHGDGKGWRINASTKKAYSFFRKYILNKGIEKKFSKEIFDLDRESRLYILAGYFDGDGCYEKGQRKLVSSCYSKDLADQTYWLLISCQISASIGKCAISKNHYPTSSECFYRVIIPSPEVSNISKYMNSNKVPLDFISKKERLLKFFYTEDGITYLTNPINEIKEFLYTGKGFDIEMTNERRALVADGYIGSNCRFFYSNEPKIGAAIDFYSEFPMSNWEHECRNRTVKLYFDRLKEKLKLQKWCRLISHEVHLLGDCFPFIEVDCPVCNGSGRIGSDICEHDGGTVRRVIILNPDYVEVLSSPLNPDPIIALRPDEELINMVQRKTPGYEKLSTEVRKLIAAGQPIKLDNTSVSHLKYGENGYAKYGIGMVRRLFPILSYKTKLMVAQWIVAERLIVPIKIVKVGSDERPAGPADIAAVQAQLAQTANDPNLTIVTHHAFEMDFVGACFDNETEIMTKDGWKLFKDATIDDEIGTYNLNNGKLEYQKPTEKQEYDYDGEMYEFSGKHVNVKVTPNHMMLASKKEDSLSEKFEKVRADQISIKDKFIVTDMDNILEEKSHEAVNLISISNYKGKVYCFTVPNGYIITRRNGRVGIHGNSGKVLTLSNEFELINQEILDGMMINNALLNGEGPNFTHSDDTRILTNNGLKYRLEFDIEKDLVATFNLNTKEIEYQKATRKFEYDWNSIDGDDPKMKRFLTNRIDMLVTPTHRMLCRNRKLTTGPNGQKIDGQKEGFGEWDVVRAAHVKPRSKFRACVEGWAATVEDKGLYFGIKTEDFLRIIGWYVSEGYRNHSILKDGTESIRKVSFSQSPIANPETYEKMRQVLLRNNLLKISGNKNVFYLTKESNEGLVNYLADNLGFKANTKCIPQEIKNMSCDNLKILLESLVDGDGSIRPATKKKPTNKKYYSYTTVSSQLRDDVIEILFKLGFSPRFNIIKFDSPNLQTQYTISWGETETGKFPVLDSRKWNGEGNDQTQKQVIFDEDYIGKVWCVEVPNHFIITERNGLFGIHGNSAAAVGIEAMIQRLKTFREQVTDWLREAIYIPEARRQAAAGNEAFITKNDDTGEEEVVVPKIKWDNMHLRDQQQFRTFVMQLYEKGLLSAQTVLETFDFDPDQEIERKRYDALQMVALGQGLQGGMGGAGGGGDMGGGMGGLPSPGGGGEPPIGAPDMGGPGTPSEGPSAPTGGGPAIAKSSSITATQVDPSQFGGRVLKKRTRERILSEQQKQQRMYEVQQNQKKRVMDAASGGNGGTERDEKGRIINTKAERDLIPHLKKAHQDGLFGNYAIVKQFRVQAQDQEYPLDFAIPSLKIGIEADGEIFHSAPKQKAHDKERDMKLSQQGWTIVRFTDEEIEKNPQMVIQSIIKTFMQKQLYVKNMAKGQEGQSQ